jgi:hypothetical protein
LVHWSGSIELAANAPPMAVAAFSAWRRLRWAGFGELELGFILFPSARELYMNTKTAQQGCWLRFYHIFLKRGVS